ncbi:MAG: hypothetical protein AVDCRST_MAG35-2617 [uncultured Quadrisphaera sp.]|uniref:Molybdenum cofactor sulfurase middle domain-containing protein n=1 Tax=uncultured Quadrisphaera sp. TaxID=904978 RepID=A0A6J4Q2D1_9ACTN|nr:MAG: hypothetical protein AVDCRST_MAG35-2617 [uncultured Quadrisphaera sp.]
MTPPAGTRVGTVALLRRFPLKSAGGEEPQAVQVREDGVVGDRWWVLEDAAGAPLRTRDHPRLAELEASIDDAGDLSAVVDGERLTGAALAPALVRRLRTEGLVLRRGDGPGGQRPPQAPVHVISEHAERDPAAPTDCDLGHRANVVLRLDADPPGAERTWVGARLRVGGAELVLTRTPRRCLGVYADVAAPGRLAVGDEVLLLDRPGPPAAAG